jgi:hypothetical protein
MPVDYLRIFGVPRLGDLFHGPEVCNEHEASVSEPDDVVRKEVTNSETHILESCEFLAFFNQATIEVAWQLQCLILYHIENLVLGQAHLVNKAVVVVVRGW